MNPSTAQTGEGQTGEGQTGEGASAEPRGLVVWLTGRPSSGKTTLATAMRRRLMRAGFGCIVLDGDRVREAIVPAHGYSTASRAAFYETLSRLAAMLCNQGMIVLVPATAHRAAYRAAARDQASAFVEVFVDTPREECEKRDDKGLYARAHAGEIHELPGESFEIPVSPDLVAHGGHDQAAVAQLLDLVSRRVP